MTVFARRLGLPTTAGNWTGRRRHARAAAPAALLTVTALVHRHAGRAADRAVARPPRPRRLPRDQHLQRRPRGARPSRCSPCWSPPTGRARRSSDPTAAPGLATLIALTLFALPPIITNAYVAVREVPGDVKESATGMGMTGWQRSSGSSCRWRCRWWSPGIRLALVQVWATATIAALVAGPGLGPGHHRRLLPHQLRQGHRRRRRGGGGRAGARAARRASCSAPSTRRRAGSPNRQRRRLSASRVMALMRPTPSAAGLIRTRAATRRGTQKVMHMQYDVPSPRSSPSAPSSSPPPAPATTSTATPTTTPAPPPPPTRAGLDLRPGLHRGRAHGRDVRAAARRTPATTPTSSWSTPATSTCRPSPTASTSCPSTSAASSTSSTPARTATNAEPFEAGDGQQLADDGAELLDDAGITLLDLSAATDTNAFFVTQDYSDVRGVTKLSDLEGESVTLAAAPDCEGRLDCEGGLSDHTASTSPRSCRSASPAPRPTSRSSTASPARRDQHDRRHAESQGLVVLEDDKGIQPAQNLSRRSTATSSRSTPDVADVLNALMAALTTEELTELNGRSPSTARSPRTSPRLPRGARACSRAPRPRAGAAPTRPGQVADVEPVVGTSSRHAPEAGPAPAVAVPPRSATYAISVAASSRRSCSTSEPHSR